MSILAAVGLTGCSLPPPVLRVRPTYVPDACRGTPGRGLFPILERTGALARIEGALSGRTSEQLHRFAVLKTQT